jgi:hypothetical protein
MKLVGLECPLYGRGIEPKYVQVEFPDLLGVNLFFGYLLVMSN